MNKWLILANQYHILAERFEFKGDIKNAEKCRNGEKICRFKAEKKPRLYLVPC